MWSRFVMSQMKHNSWFVCGAALGLWASLALVPLEPEAGCEPAPAPPAAADDFEPVLEARPAAPRAPAPRSLQRPRYYTTELGMRGSVVVGMLSSEEALAALAPAHNRSLQPLQPAVRFFVPATAARAKPLPNVVGFTDTREMLRPFHALKYLADNFLEEYDFFFLVTDESFVHARRLAELAARLSRGRDVHLGAPEPGSQYCSLRAGLLLSNSVLRAVHAELEWCVRNSYSPHHHENVGRCVLHAAHAPCAPAAQGQAYAALELGAAPPEALAGAVTARPVRAPADVARLHALAARLGLQRARAEAARARAQLARTARAHPPGYRNASWPAGLRADPGLAAPRPADRHSHARWTAFNATHALMPDETRAAAPLAAPAARALRLLLAEVRAWLGPGPRAELLEGAVRWEAAEALRYRLLLRLTAPDGATALKQVEAVRPLGAARLVPVRYVTEGARVTLLLAVPAAAAREARDMLARAAPVLFAQDGNAALLVAAVGGNDTAFAELQRDVSALAAAHGAAAADLLRLEGADDERAPEDARLADAGDAALRAAAARLPPDALLLLAPPHLEFNRDFLNRARMNAIPGEQWFAPEPFARHALYSHPRFVTAEGARPATGTGRFRRARSPLLAAYAGDVAAALAAGARDAHAALAASALRCVRAPEPGAVLRERGAACGAPGARAACLAALGAPHERLELGARGALARLLLEVQSEA